MKILARKQPVGPNPSARVKLPIDALFYRALGFCFLIFAFHRFTTFDILAANFSDLTFSHKIQCFLVGLASDFWTGTLLASVALAISAIIPRPWLRWPALTAATLVGILISAHQAYVEFYRSPIALFHLSYLLDMDFLSSSMTSGISLRVLLNLFWMLVAGWLVLRTAKNPQQPTRSQRPDWQRLRDIGFVMLAALLIHASQIRYRVQWFIPGPLQFSPLEKIYFDLHHAIEIPQLTETEVALLNNMRRQLQQEIDADNSKVSQIRKKLKESFQKSVTAGDAPILAVMALETFRPSEIEVYQTENQGSESEELTPAFNELTRSGIFFRSAWSSGTITATGQEALWCGAPSGLTTSLMRFQTHLNVTCIPDLVHVAGGRSLWIHNGEQRFDNQGSFWRRHHVDRIISSVDFPPGTPGGSWGLSDLALAHKAVKEIAEARRNPDAKYIAPFILTVANHIPWDLPADAPDRIKEMTAEESPNLAMWRTTAYTDAAIKLFVEELKKQQLWDRTILVLASDHGNLEPGRSPPERRQSQIALLITGGITQRILFESGKTANIEIQHPVGQTGVANLIRHIIGETPEVAEKRLPDILAWPNWWPAISDQNEILFIPGLRQEEDLTLDKRKLVPDAESNLRNDLDNTRLERASLIYRGTLLR